MAKIHHKEKMKEQEEYFKAEIDMLESIISQLGNNSRDMRAKEIELQMELVQLKRNVSSAQSFNSEIVSWSSAIRQENANLRSQLVSFKSRHSIEPVLRERYLMILMICHYF